MWLHVTFIYRANNLTKFFCFQFNKHQQEGKEDKFKVGKKKNHEDFVILAEESEKHYKACVVDANARQSELERTKADVLLELRRLVCQCDTQMKSCTISYFNMMYGLVKTMPTHFKTLAEGCKTYEEGQQFSEYVRLAQSTSNQAMCPKYHFEPYRSESERFGYVDYGC